MGDNAYSALCAYQSQVGPGNNGLSGNIVVYDTTYLETNEASCRLHKSTGKFMAGKSGVYQISISADSAYTQDDKYFFVYLRTPSGKERQLGWSMSAVLVLLVATVQSTN